MYKCNYWWFELIEMGRKLIMSGLLIYIADQDIRVGVGFIICFLALLITFSFRPFVSEQLNRLILSSLSIQCLTNAYGLLLLVKQRVGTSTAVAYNELRGLEVLCVLLNCILIIAPFVMDLLEGSWKVIKTYINKDNAPHHIKFAALSAEVESTDDDASSDNNSCHKPSEITGNSKLNVRFSRTISGSQQESLKNQVDVDVNALSSEELRTEVGNLITRLKKQGRLSGNQNVSASLGHMTPAVLEGTSTTRSVDIADSNVEDNARGQTSNQTAASGGPFTTRVVELANSKIERKPASDQSAAGVGV